MIVLRIFAFISELPSHFNAIACSNARDRGVFNHIQNFFPPKMNYEAHFYNLDLISERRASAVILFSNTNKGDRNLKKKKRWEGDQSQATQCGECDEGQGFDLFLFEWDQNKHIIIQMTPEAPSEFHRSLQILITLLSQWEQKQAHAVRCVYDTTLQEGICN